MLNKVNIGTWVLLAAILGSSMSSVDSTVVYVVFLHLDWAYLPSLQPYAVYPQLLISSLRSVHCRR